MTMAKEFKPQGYKCVCNNGGYEIELDERGERARFRLFGDTVTRWTMDDGTVQRKGGALLQYPGRTSVS